MRPTGELRDINQKCAYHGYLLGGVEKPWIHINSASADKILIPQIRHIGELRDINEKCACYRYLLRGVEKPWIYISYTYATSFYSDVDVTPILLLKKHTFCFQHPNNYIIMPRRPPVRIQILLLQMSQ